MTKTATETTTCRLCNEPMPGPYRGHATDFPDDPYKHDAQPVWRFNKDYHDHDQVAPFFDGYIRAYLALDGAYPYNDSFRGQIVGIEGPDEDTAIYLLQSTRHLIETFEQVAQARAEGCVDLEEVGLTETTKFSRIVQYGWYMGGTGFREWADARLVPESNPRQVEITGIAHAVIPKGKRTHGHLLMGGRVLVKR